jgi:hypothetical protein
MAMLGAYFDASRTRVQAGAYVIGGYLGSENLWTDLEAEWSANLSYWKVADFHLTDCLAGRGEFERPGFDSHKRQLCALSFGQIIHRARPEAVWSGLLDEDWEALEASPAFRARYPSPYQYLFHDILWQLARVGHGRYAGEMIAPVFDADASPASVEPIYAGLKTSPAYDNLVASVTFGSRRKYMPLQAADILAGEMQHHWFDREYPSDPTIKFPFWRNLLVYATPMGNVGGLWLPDTLKRAAAAFDQTGDPFNWEGFLRVSSQ